MIFSAKLVFTHGGLAATISPSSWLPWPPLPALVAIFPSTHIVKWRVVMTSWPPTRHSPFLCPLLWCIFCRDSTIITSAHSCCHCDRPWSWDGPTINLAITSKTRVAVCSSTKKIWPGGPCSVGLPVVSSLVVDMESAAECDSFKRQNSNQAGQSRRTTQQTRAPGNMM